MPAAHDHHQALHALHEAPADEVADRVEVVRRAREHLTGRVPVVERARIAEVRRVEQLAHPRLDADADARGRVAAGEVDEEAQSGEDDDADDVRPERARVRHDRVVDRALHEQRDRDRDQRVTEREREAERAESPLRPPQTEQPAEGRQQAEVGRIDGIRVLGHGEDARPKLSFPLDELSPEPSSELVARASAREGGEAFAEARRCKRRVERLPHVCHFAPAQRALAVEKRVALGVEALAHERKLTLARLELRLEHAKLVSRGARSGRARGRARGPAPPAPAPARVPPRSRAAPPPASRPPARGLERALLGLELDPAGGELLLDPACLLLPLLEPRALGGCELPLRLRLAALRLRPGERRLELPLSLGETRCARFELRLARLELPLTGLERLQPLECSSLTGDERIAGGGRLALLLCGLAGVEAALQLHQLALAGRHRLRPLAERLLQLLELGVCLLVVRMPLVGKLTREAEERRLVGVDAGVVGDAAPAAARRPAVEPLFPAVYACSLCQQTLSM